MTIKQYDRVILKDKREGCVVEAFENEYFIVDTGSSPADWETIDVQLEDIAEVIP